AADRQEALARDGVGGEIDHAGPDFAGIVHRVALLAERRGGDAAGGEVERNDALERLGAGQRQAVQQRERIAGAEAADVDLGAADQREAGDTAERAGDVAFARPRDLGGGEDAEDLVRRLGDIAVAGSGDDDLPAAARDRDVDFVFGRCGRRLGGI